METVAQAIRIVKEPSEVFWEIKQRPKWSAAFGILLAAIVVRILAIFITSFHYQAVDPENANLLSEVSKVVLPWLSWVIANYAVTTILDGEGSVKQVAVFSAFALVPYVFLTVPVALATNVLTLGERFFIDTPMSIAFVWSGVLYFLGTRVIHNYTNKQTFWICVLSIFTASLTWAVLALMYGLSNQVVRFIEEIIVEVSIR